ncbi:hypothetical protein DMN91_002708 [Ooceraea biroi]|uniref:Protein lethal(2)essential for life n=2 Tax=Ooceraea biroi TaxID=2015173 RepID=A0A026WNA3_OOCBI|nr:protein lethal(2)essential for life [Ooceraea biroi]EZA57515.1 Protein lethal(2)essential for life [Ooceraea biroi]RLU24619.1 hypothetical protein DMN91_002708 [Ooceraea biroi]
MDQRENREEMSRLQLLFINRQENLKRTYYDLLNLLNRDFGRGPQSELLPLSSLNRQRDHAMEPRNLLQQRENKISSAPPVNKEDLQVVLDVQHFEPQEIEVKVVDDCLVVTAKHEEKRDEHGWVSRQFVRRYQLPEDSNVEQLTVRLSSDGLLTIVAPKKRPEKEERE